MKKKPVKILVIESSKEPKIMEIKNDFRAMQNIVKGRFQFMPFDSSDEACELMVNEEYLMNGSEFNRFIQSDYHTVENGGATVYGVPVMGTFAVVRHDFETGEMVSLTDADIEKYQQTFKL